MIPSGRSIARYFFVRRLGLLRAVVALSRLAFEGIFWLFWVSGRVAEGGIYLASRMLK